MLSLDDKRWSDLKGGYRLPFDQRPLLLKLESGTDVDAAWEELWEEVHHQGDVGEASYAAVPHLVRIYRQPGIPDWNTYAIVACIELCRGKRSNPELPKWLEEDYFHAIEDLAVTGVAEFERVKEPEVIRGILIVLAISKSARTYGKLLLEYSEKELLDFDELDLES
jgi:hypothetical protein